MQNVCLCGFLFLAAAVAAGQQGDNQRFEVASVKVFSDPVLIMSGVTSQPGGRIAAKAATVKDLVAFAYDVLLREIEGGADWMTVERFDIEARAKEEASLEQLRLMLRSLLAERFGLRVRTVSKTVDAYALLTGRGGLRLKPSDAGACVQEQLGLRFESTKAPVSVIVLEAATRPTPN